MKYINVFLILLFTASTSIAFAKDGENGVNDVFKIKSISGQEAVIQGKLEDLAVNDKVYFNRPPYQFTVKSVDKAAGTATIALPASHELTTTNTVVRYQSVIIRGLASKQKQLDDLENQ